MIWAVAVALVFGLIVGAVASWFFTRVHTTGLPTDLSAKVEHAGDKSLADARTNAKEITDGSTTTADLLRRADELRARGRSDR